MNTIEYMTRLDVLPSGKAGVLILSAPMMDPEVHFMIFLAVQNLGLAMADDVVEVMIVENKFRNVTPDARYASWL